MGVGYLQTCTILTGWYTFKDMIIAFSESVAVRLRNFTSFAEN